jgi:hypothetical protein
MLKTIGCGSHQAAVRTRSPKRVAKMIRAVARHEHHDHVIDAVCTVARSRPLTPQIHVYKQRSISAPHDPTAPTA